MILILDQMGVAFFIVLDDISVHYGDSWTIPNMKELFGVLYDSMMEKMYTSIII